MKKIMFMILVLYGFINASCVNNNNDTVSCNDSNLMWMDDSSSAAFLNIADLSSITNFCETVTFPSAGGFNDWRVPNINELLSIVYNTTNNYPPFIDQDMFLHRNTDVPYISSTTYANNTDHVLTFNFNSGELGHGSKTSSYARRCVRDIQ